MKQTSILIIYLLFFSFAGFAQNKVNNRPDSQVQSAFSQLYVIKDMNVSGYDKQVQNTLNFSPTENQAAINVYCIQGEYSIIQPCYPKKISDKIITKLFHDEK